MKPGEWREAAAAPKRLPAPEIRRWPIWARLLIIIGSSSALWCLIVGAIRWQW